MTDNTICAIATPPGMGATAMIRISGNKAFDYVRLIVSDSTKLDKLNANEAKLFNIVEPNIFKSETSNLALIDQVVVTKYVAPHSFTGENVVEISCHGSIYIQRRIVELLIENGCRMAEPGEFTQRAFINGKLDLPQAEAISDLISAQTETSHSIAMQQLRGSVSKKMSILRQEFLQLSSLLELELDFSEEDVQFADRSSILNLLSLLKSEVSSLLNNYKWGNVIKNGIPVAIVGKPNTGKSTLMNAILERDRAIVSDIPGTTRDTIEDTFVIDGVLFRFIDTAGIRNSSDEIENLGIERTYQTIDKAEIVIYVFDANKNIKDVDEELHAFYHKVTRADKNLLLVANKSDMLSGGVSNYPKSISVSAKYGENIDNLLSQLTSYISENMSSCNTSIVCNERHFFHLNKVASLINDVEAGIDNDLSTDLLAEDVKLMLHHIGEITGEISSDDILNNIFSNFCIGK